MKSLCIILFHYLSSNSTPIIIGSPDAAGAGHFGREAQAQVIHLKFQCTCVATQEKSDSEVNVDSKELKQKLTSIENYERLG